MTRIINKKPGEKDFSEMSHAEFLEVLKQIGVPLHRSTRFGRHVDVFRYLQDVVIPEMAKGHERLDALVIGSGLQTNLGMFPREYRGGDSMWRKWSWEYLHVAGMLEGERQKSDGKFDYGVTVIDKDPLVAEAVRRQTSIVVGERSNGADEEYTDDFLPGARRRRLSEETNVSLVLIPGDVRSRINVIEGDITKIDAPESDVIFYLIVFPILEYK